jgi:hypothetical protein
MKAQIKHFFAYLTIALLTCLSALTTKVQAQFGIFLQLEGTHLHEHYLQAGTNTVYFGRTTGKLLLSQPHLIPTAPIHSHRTQKSHPRNFQMAAPE